MKVVLITAAFRGDLKSLSRREPRAVFIKPSTRQMICGGAFVRLQPQPFNILSALFFQRGDKLSENELADLLWRNTMDGGPLSGAKVIGVALCYARKVIRPWGFTIENQFGFGWRISESINGESIGPGFMASKRLGNPGNITAGAERA